MNRTLVFTVALLSFLTLAAPASAQTAASVARVFHPSAPLPSYEVATIKPWVYSPPVDGVMWSSGDTVRELIRQAFAFGADQLRVSQVVGGPVWIDKDQFKIDGKPPADLELAMRKMTYADRSQQDHAMLQSLLADRFHLRVHFEIRVLPVYTLSPAKGGLKIRQAAPPASNSPPSAPPLELIEGRNGLHTLKAHSITMTRFIQALALNLNQTGDRPVLDRTGFTGYFDIASITWASLESATASDPSGAPSLETALEETLGLRLAATKGPVEVVVIDSVDHPSAN